MSRVNRFDRSSSLKPPVRLDNGFVRLDGNIAGIGIQVYHRPDGSVSRELRLPEEVFNADSMASFHFLPVTNQHPPGMLTAKNAKRYQVGSVGESVRQDGNYLAATMLVTDADAIAAIESGRTQLSAGYSCELDPTQDEELTAKWGKYDAIMRNIRANHVAVVDVARAGPGASLRLDAVGNMIVDSNSMAMAEEKDMHKFTMDGLTLEVADANAQAIIERAVSVQRDRADAAEKREIEKDKRITELTAKVDMQDAEIKELKDSSAKAAAAKVDEFKQLLALGSEVAKLGVDVSKCDHDPMAYKAAALKKMRPGLSVEGKSADYIDAAYDVAKQQQPSAVELARAGRGPAVHHDDSDDNSAEAARQRMLKRNAEMCK